MVPLPSGVNLFDSSATFCRSKVTVKPYLRAISFMLSKGVVGASDCSVGMWQVTMTRRIKTVEILMKQDGPEEGRGRVMQCPNF